MHPLLTFQFLMVRLKVAKETAGKPKQVFQFLMVRLKGFSNSSTDFDSAFQFLMVRLKDEHLPENPFAHINFNSLWFD